jgi:putative oxidoreductase
MTIVQTLLGIFFLVVGVPKLFRLTIHRNLFEKYHYPLWLLMLVGLVETSGGALLLLGTHVAALEALTIIGVMLIIADMLGVMITHFRAHEWAVVPVPVVLAVIAVFIGVKVV